MNAAGGLEFARGLVEAHYAGRWWQLEQGAYRAIAIEGAATVAVLGPKIGNNPDPFLSLACGVAKAVPHSAALHELVNAENKETFFGSTYIEPGANGTASVISQLLIPLEPVAWEAQASIQWAAKAVNSVIARADLAAQRIPGERFGRGDAYILWMLT